MRSRFIVTTMLAVAAMTATGAGAGQAARKSEPARGSQPARGSVNLNNLNKAKLRTPSQLNEKAPDAFQAKFDTTKGVFVI